VGFCLAFFCFWTSLYVYMPAFPVYAESLGASLTVVGLIIAAYGLVQFVLRIPIGYLSDRYGIRLPFMTLGLIAIAIGSIGMGLFPDPVLLIIWRGFHGVGATSFVISAVYFAGFFRPDQAANATGQLLFMSAVFIVIASMVGGVLAENLGVPFTFWASAVIALVGTAAILLVGERPVGTHQRMSIRRFTHVLSIRTLLVASGIAALAQFVMWSLNIGFVPIFAHSLGASKADLGTLTTITFLSYGISSLIAPRLSNRFGTLNTIVAGSLFTTITIVILPSVATVPALIALQAVNGVARGTVFPLLMGISIQNVSEHERASAMGIFQSIYALGMFAGPATAGLIADAIGLAGLFFVISLFPILGLVSALVWLRGIDPPTTTTN
jgi:MFS family permease